MAYEMRENTGSLFKNDKAREGKSDPQATGTALIGGVEYWVSAWTKDGKSGKWQSLAFKPKEKQASSRPENQPEELEEDIPF